MGKRASSGASRIGVLCRAVVGESAYERSIVFDERPEIGSLLSLCDVLFRVVEIDGNCVTAQPKGNADAELLSLKFERTGWCCRRDLSCC